jgi:predicted lipoprotein
VNARRGAAALLMAMLAVTALTACGNDKDSNATRADVLRSLSTTVITPAYVQLDRATAGLASATTHLCKVPDQTQLRAARTAWDSAWSAWNRTRAFRFGPLTETRANADIAFMIDPRKIDKLLTESKAGPALTASSLGEKGADVRGLAAGEHLLFERDSLDPTTCAYAADAAELVAAAAHDVRLAWTDGTGGDPAFRDQLAKPGAGMYSDEQAAVGDLVNGLSMALTESSRELADVQGAPPGEREVVGSHGGSRLRDVLWSLRATYFGATSGTTGDGVSDLVAAVSATADKRVSELLERADRSVNALAPSLVDAPAAELTKAYRAERDLGIVVRAEVASELGVTLSLGDADGDS